MADGNDGGNSAGLRAFLAPVLTLILGTLLVTQIDWDLKRPIPDKDSVRRAGIQLDARLWMDPLEPPRGEKSSGALHDTGEDDMGGQIIRHLTDPVSRCSERKINFLAVMVDGGSFAENAERRRRARYAIVSGLMATGYQPEDRDHIRYLRLDRPYDFYDPRKESRVLSTAERQMPEVIPYEWFQSSTEPKCPVLVLWLDEGQISERPLQKLLIVKNLMRMYPLHALYSPTDGVIVANRQLLLADRLTKLIRGEEPPGYRTWLKGLMKRLGENPDATILSQWLKHLETAWNCNHRQSKSSESGGEEKSSLTCKDASNWQNWRRSGSAGAPVTAPSVPRNAGALAATSESAGAAAAPNAGERKPDSWDIPPHSYLFQVLGARASAEVITSLGAWLGQSLIGTEEEAVVKPESYDFRIIGPASSDTLRALVLDLQSPEFKPTETLAGAAADPSVACPPKMEGAGNISPSTFTMFSPAASIEDALLFKNLGSDVPTSNDKGNFNTTIKGTFSASEICIERVITSDGHLASAILEELTTQRRLKTAVDEDAGPEFIKDHIALVFESDTTYARNLKESFISQLCAIDTKGKPLNDESTRRCRQRRENLSFSYFQGLDGEGVSKPKFNNGRDAGGKANGAAPASIDDLVQLAKPPITKASFADDQTDYLERIALAIELQDRRLRRHGQAVRAIGLLGSDVFDKMQLLNTLRPRFPDAIFFTTELDGRFVDGTPSPMIARNLLIASGFDLELEPSIRKFIPRFRGSEQTAYFYATLRALGAVPPPEDAMDAKLFEVGRTTLFPLASGKAGPARVCPCGPKDGVDGEYAESYDIPAGWCSFKHLILQRWAAVPVIVVAGLYLLFRSVRPENRGLILILAAVGSVGLFILGLGISNSSEPFTWVEGISIWPTEFIRLGAILLGLYFLANQYRQRQQLMTWPKLVRPKTYRETRRRPILTGLDRYFEPLKDAPVMVWRNRWIIAMVIVSVALGLFIFGLYFRFQDSAGNGIILFLALISLWLIWLALKPNDEGSGDLQKLWFYAPLLLTVCLSLLSLSQLPVVPCRDSWSCNLDRAFLGTTIVIFLLLLSTALVVSRDVHDWLQRIEPQVEKMDSPRRLAIVIDRIGAETGKVQALILKPFIIAALMLVSRNRAFDNWSMPPGLLAIFLFSFGLMALCAYGVWEPASRIRDNKRKQLRQTRRLGESDIEKALENQEGAYGGLLSGPIVKGLAVMAGGAGLEPILAKILDLLG